MTMKVRAPDIAPPSPALSLTWPAYYYALLTPDGRRHAFRTWPSLAGLTRLLACDTLSAVAVGLLNHPPDDQVMLIDPQAREASKPLNPYATGLYCLLFPESQGQVYGSVVLTFTRYFA